MQKFLFILVLLSSGLLLAQNTVSGQTIYFDFSQVVAEISIYPENKNVEGNVSFYFEVLDSSDTLKIDGRNMHFTEVFLNGEPAEYYTDDSGIYITHSFQQSENNKINLKYSVKPSSGIYFINWDLPGIDAEDKQVWTQGQGKYTSTWLPSFDDMREKVEFDLSINFPSGFEVISNGVLTEKQKVNDSITSWKFVMDKPMSSYLVGIAAGVFDSKEIESSTGDDIKLFYKPEDSLKFEPTYRYSARIMDFLEKEIGVEYPWQNYKQVPVQDFLYSGMENTGATIFSNSLMVDSIGYNDYNYVSVNAHELAHQWFGNLVTESNGDHHWLHEGFATYYALLAEREIFGDEYYYWKLFQSAETLQEKSDSGKGESLLDPKASSLTFYQKGAWALHMLREKIGDEAFKQGVKNYLHKYAFQNVEVDDFIAAMQKASGIDLTSFAENWLKQTAFKSYAALESLKRSEFIRNYLNIASLKEIPLDEKYELLDKALDFPTNDYIGQEVVYQLAGLQSEQAIDLYKKAFETNNLYIRQAIAISMEKIPASLKADFESLLEDQSYLTMEAALFKLWEQFPSSRKNYFDNTRGIDGFYNKNVRMLWLTLNLVTPEIDGENTQQHYEELVGYTGLANPFQVRENAFGYLYQIGAFNENSLRSLVKGTQHHTYAFRDYCRKLIQELLKNQQYREQLSHLVNSMEKNETAYLRLKMNG